MSLSLVELKFDNLQSYLESGDSSYLPLPVWNIVSTGFPELHLIPSFLPSPPCALDSEDTIFGCPPRINLIKLEGKDHIRAICYFMWVFIISWSSFWVRLLPPFQAHTLWMRSSCDQYPSFFQSENRSPWCGRKACVRQRRGPTPPGTSLWWVFQKYAPLSLLLVLPFLPFCWSLNPPPSEPSY